MGYSSERPPNLVNTGAQSKSLQMECSLSKYSNHNASSKRRKSPRKPVAVLFVDTKVPAHVNTCT